MLYDGVLRRWQRKCCGNSGCTSKIQLKLKSHKMSFPHNWCHSFPIILTFYTEHKSITVVLCAKLQNDLATEMDVLDDQVFLSFDCKMSLQGISDRSVQVPNLDCFGWSSFCKFFILTHWGRVTHICISRLRIIVSNNGLSPGWCQAIIWTNAGILLIGPLGTNFYEILIKIYTFSLKKCIWKCHLENGGHFVSASMC